MSAGYIASIENAETTWPELAPLYSRHYAEMQARMRGQGIDLPPFNPRLDVYFARARDGSLLNYVLRADGAPIGYSNIYLTSDMHNGELVAREDTIYVLPEHRNGVGRRLSKFIIADLRARGVRRFNVTAATDPRATKLWQRLGFREAAVAMTYVFEEPADVRT